MQISQNIIYSIVAGFIAGQVIIAADNRSQPTEHKQNLNNTASTDQNSKPDPGQTILFSQLPGAVQKTMRAEAPGLNIEKIHKITRNGQTCYQGTFDKAGLKGRLTVSEDGSLLQYQESTGFVTYEAAPGLNTRGKSTMKYTELPEPVRKAVSQRAGSHQLGDVFKTTEPQSGKTAYHVAFDDGAAMTDLLVDEQGNVLYRSDETALFTAPIEDSKSLSFQSAPRRVQDAIRQRGGSAETVSDIDKGTWNGQTVYKVMIEKNGSFRPLLISENGQIIKPGASSGTATGSAATSQQGAAHESLSKPSTNSGQK